MSESTIPYAGQPGLDGPNEERVSDGNRTKLMLLGGIAAALVLGLLAYFLLFSGSDEAEGEAAPVAAGPAAAPVAPDPAEAVEGEDESENVSAKSFGKDPFKALIVEPQIAPASGTTDPATGAPVVEEITETTSYRFKVVDVAPDNSTVTVKVNDEVYRNLTAGETFADYFKVRLIGGSVNSFQFGEETFNVVGSEALTIG